MKIQYFSFSSRPEKGITDTQKSLPRKGLQTGWPGLPQSRPCQLTQHKGQHHIDVVPVSPSQPQAKDHFHCCCIMTIKLSHITPTVYCTGVASQTSDDHIQYHCPTIGPHYP